MKALTITTTFVAALAITSMLAVPSVLAQEYDVRLVATLNPASSGAIVELHVEQSSGSLKKLAFTAPTDLFSSFDTDSGKVTRSDGRVEWKIPSNGGSLTWHATLNVPKGDAYDARITEQWALLRFEDLFPPVRSTARKGSTSNFVVELRGPKTWSFETRYGRVNKTPLRIESLRYNFDRPTGWLIAGNLGVRREQIAGRSVTVAAPEGTHFPRVPTLAFLRWTLPDLVKVFPNMSERLLVVSGNDEMWRGALSGPSSLFLHGDRPLISENGTSTLLHELVHVATRITAAPGDDWVVEGLAEYYSLEILRRSDGISQQRFSKAMMTLQEWASRTKASLSDPSKGSDTAAAALLFKEIATELRDRPDNTLPYPLDCAIQALLSDALGNTVVSAEDLQNSISEVTGHSSEVLAHALRQQKKIQESGAK